MTSFSFFKYFDAFELDVNVVNFVYNGKTRIKNCDTKNQHTFSAARGRVKRSTYLMVEGKLQRVFFLY